MNMNDIAAAFKTGTYGLLSLPVSAYAGGRGLLELIRTGDPEAAEAAINDAQGLLRFEPQTVEDEAAMHALGEAGQALDAPFQAVGGAANRAAGPLAGAAAYTMSQFLPVGLLARRFAQGPSGPGRIGDPRFPREGGIIAAGPADAQIINRPPEVKGLLQTHDQHRFTSPSGVLPGDTVRAAHFSHDPNLQAVLAGRYGTSFPGDEAARLASPSGVDVQPRAFFYLDRPDLAPERGVGPHRYDFTVSGMYDIAGDPAGIMKQAREIAGRSNLPPAAASAEAANIAERMMRDAGYRGAYNKNAPQGGSGYTFEDIDLSGKTDSVRMAREHHASRLGGNIPPEDVSRMGAAAGVGSNLEGDYTRIGKKYRGSPGLQSPQALAGLRGRLTRDARTGEPAADWYKRDAQALAQMTSGQFGPARKTGGGLSITSPQTSVSGNALEGTRAYYQNLVGDAIRAGRFPEAMGKDFKKIVDDVSADIGRKRGSFVGNELAYWPEVPQGTTMDMQMKRAFRYPTKGDNVTDYNYEFMERMTKEIADRLNKEGGRHWDPMDVQAAIWTAQKMRKEKTGADVAGGNFIDTLRESTVDVPWEARPGIEGSSGALSTGWDPVNNLYQQDILRGLTDEWGNNVIARDVGLLQLPQHRGVGVWGDERNPNAVMNAVAPPIGGPLAADLKVSQGLGKMVTEIDKKTGKPFEKYKSNATSEAERYLERLIDNQIDPAARKAVAEAAAATGSLLDQAGAGWIKPAHRSVPGYAQNSAEIRLPNFQRNDLKMFADEIDTVSKEFASHHPSMANKDGALAFDIVVSPLEDGVRITRPHTEGMTTGGAKLGIDHNKAAKKIVQTALDNLSGRLKAKGYGDVTPSWGMADSDLYMHSSYDDLLGTAGREAIEKYRPFVEAHQQWYEKHYPEAEQFNLANRRRSRFGKQGLLGE